MAYQRFLRTYGEAAATKVAKPAKPPVPEVSFSNFSRFSAGAFAADEKASIGRRNTGVPELWVMGFSRLCAMPRPREFSEAFWLRLIDDAGQFLGVWGHKAAALGWASEDLFGVHPAAPAARQDAKGLILLLNGSSVEALSETTCSLRATSGSRHTYRRQLLGRPEQVLIWDLRTKPDDC